MSEPSTRSARTALVATLLFVGCADPSSRLPAEAVAGFDDRHVTYDDFEGWVRSSTGDQTVALSAPALSGLFDQYLEQLLLEHRAQELGLVGEHQPAAATRRLLERFPPEPVTDEDVERRYREAARDFLRPERVKLRQLLFEDRAEAEAVVARIESGAEFGEIAARRFPDVGERAGWLGELSREDLPPELVEPVFSTPAGTATGVLANQTGFHVFWVEERLPAQTAPLASVEGEIREWLEGEARRAQLDRLVAEARERYNLVFAAERLPFAYSPSRPSPTEPPA